jgi:hypothetical protein
VILLVEEEEGERGGVDVRRCPPQGVGKTGIPIAELPIQGCHSKVLVAVDDGVWSLGSGIRIFGDLTSQLHQVQESFVDLGFQAFLEASWSTGAEALELLGEGVYFEIRALHELLTMEQLRFRDPLTFILVGLPRNNAQYLS